MRVLFVLSRVPWPLEKGDKLRAYHLIEEMAKAHEVLLFCVSDSKVHPEAYTRLKGICTEVLIYRLSLLGIITRLATALFSEIPFQVSYFNSRRAKKAFDGFVKNHLPTHMFVQLVRMTEYVKKYEVLHKSLDYMDALAYGMQRMSTKTTFPMKQLRKIEAKRLSSYEHGIYPYFKSHFIISTNDKLKMSILRPILVVPNGVNPKYFNLHSQNSKKWHILFTGNMNYKPNVESAKYLVNEIMPMVWQENPEVKVCLAGSSPNTAVKALENKRVTVTGWIDDMTEVYNSSEVFVAPMFINSGLQNKLLEAMASSLPCITTTLANEALGAIPESQICIANTPYEFANQIIYLLSNSEKAYYLAQNGKKFVKANFSWIEAAKNIMNNMEC